jgi:hypothetical protein
VHFWPFDGWDIPGSGSVVAEVYPALFNKGFARDGRDPYQHDAYSITAWMRNADASGSLMVYFAPHLEEGERRVAQIEGWILGLA